MALTENPKLAMIPSGYGDYKVYSVLPSDGTGDFDFVRSSAATRVNKDGLIETVGFDVPRLNYPLIDGVVSGCPSLLLENESRNLIPYSEDFSQSSWVKSNTTVSSNQVISPDGTLNAFKLTEDNASSTKLIFKSGISTLGTISVFAKKGDDNNRLFQIRRDGGSNSWSWFNLDDGIVLKEENGIASIENYGNGWYRCSFTPTNSNGTIVFGISNGSLGRSVSYQGDGTSGVYIWGAQLEEGSFPTSYIPNFGTALGVTRSSETCNNSGNANTFNDSEGVLFAEAAALSNDGTYRNICLSDGGLINRILIQYTPTSNQINIVVIYSGGQYSLSHTVSSVMDFSKFLIKYKANDLALWVNGFEVDTSANSNLPIGLNTLSFDNTVSDAFYSNTKQIQYFDTALTDTDLEELTSWTSFNEMAESQLYSVY